MAEATPPSTNPVPDPSANPPDLGSGGKSAAFGPQLPVVDLIGLRFSLLHLRLVGYGLMAVWLSEMVAMLTEPDLGAVSSRLHYISQFLDLSPILLASIGLIAFQGGLRRGIWEVLLLPLLLSFLPLLSAFHFFLAPMTVANTVTLVHKQEEIGKDQMERIDQQIDRAAAILRESDNIDSLVEGLQRIPGLRVQVPANAQVQEARREVRISLEQDRDRLRERIRSNLSTTREAFLRRTASNASLALLMGLVLWGVHRGAVREMQQSVPFIEWVLVHGDVGQSHDVLREVLRFQRTCLALGWFSLAERILGLMRRVIRPASDEENPEELRNMPPPDLTPPAAYPPPFDPGRLSIIGQEQPPLFAPFRAPAGYKPAFHPEDEELFPGDPEEHGGDPLPSRPQRGEADRPFWQRWQRQRQRRLAREALRRQAESPLFLALQGSPPPQDTAAPNADSATEVGAEAPARDPLELTPGQMRSRQRDLKRSRKAMSRLADQEFLVMIGQEAPPPAPPPSLPSRTPSLTARLWRWFVTHL